MSSSDPAVSPSPSPSLSPSPSPAPVPPQVMEQLLATASANPRAEPFVDLIKSAAASLNLSLLQSIATFLYEIYIPLSQARLVYTEYCTTLLSLSEPPFMSMAQNLFALHARPNNPRALAFEHSLTAVRDRASLEFERRGEWERAAEELSHVPFETLVSTPNHGMLRFNLRIARLFISAGNTDKAELHTNRANTQLAQCMDDDASLHQLFCFCQARILDSKRKFEDAAMKYYQLSQHAAHMRCDDAMSDGDFGDALMHAVTCAILAPAGPRRSRVLAILYNDERSRGLDMFALLESIHMGRLLRREQIEKFRPTLLPHQLTTHNDGDTVLDRAVMEHNLLAASRLYTNIRCDELGVLLGISSEKAETTAARMIFEKRMTASIDQVEGVVEFLATGPTEKIERWDAQIAGLCTAVDDCVEAIIDQHPQFAALLES